jgi:hypothetical protein
VHYTAAKPLSCTHCPAKRACICHQLFHIIAMQLLPIDRTVAKVAVYV